MRSQPPDRFVQGVTSLRFAGLRPQDAHEMCPGPPVLGRQRKVDEQREVLAAQQFGGRGAPAEARARHAKALQLEEREVRHVRCRWSKISLNLLMRAGPGSQSGSVAESEEATQPARDSIFPRFRRPSGSLSLAALRGRAQEGFDRLALCARLIYDVHHMSAATAGRAAPS